MERCRFKKFVVGSSCSSYEDIPKASELDLQEAVAKEGPVAVGIDAKHYEFKFYDHGVFDFPKCSSTKLNHGMLVVGYGRREGRDYWLVKNRYVLIGWLNIDQYVCIGLLQIEWVCVCWLKYFLLVG